MSVAFVSFATITSNFGLENSTILLSSMRMLFLNVFNALILSDLLSPSRWGYTELTFVFFFFFVLSSETQIITQHLNVCFFLFFRNIDKYSHKKLVIEFEF